MVKKTKVALDTNIVSEVLKKQQDTIEKLKGCTPCLPITVYGEYLYGAKNSSRIQKNTDDFESFAEDCEILNINETVAKQYSDIRKSLKDKGKPIPENDIWIAATCQAYQIPLATRDKHFGHIDNLDLFEL